MVNHTMWPIYIIQPYIKFKANKWSYTIHKNKIIPTLSMVNRLVFRENSKHENTMSIILALSILYIAEHGLIACS